MDKKEVKGRMVAEMDNIISFMNGVIDAKFKENKVIFVALAEYHAIVNELGYVPEILKFHPYLPDNTNTAYIVDLDIMSKPILKNI